MIVRWTNESKHTELKKTYHRITYVCSKKENEEAGMAGKKIYLLHSKLDFKHPVHYYETWLYHL